MSSQNGYPLEEGLGHLQARRLNEAITAFRAALAREPGRFAVVRGWVTACVLQEDAQSAREITSRFVADHPMVAEGWRLAAQLEWKLGARDEAIETLRSGLKRLPNSPALHKQLAIFLSATGKPTPSSHTLSGHQGDPDWLDQIASDSVLLEAILTAIESGPTVAGNSRHMLTQLSDKLSTLLESQPSHADRQLLLARVRAAIDDCKGSLAAVERALHLNPRLIAAHRLKAKLLAGAGEFGAAIELLRQLLKRGLPWPDLHFELAALEREKGQLESARGHLYSAVTLNPQFERAKELLERMAA